MFSLLRMAAFAACFIAFSAAAQAPSANSGLTDLAYSVQPGNSLYFTGKYQGKPVNLVRNGVIGSGKWTIYTGTLADRVRLTIDDQKGLQEILAMDKGQRITVSQVGQERTEYRLYAPDRSFIIGSVLYRSKGRWLQGMMKTEVFAGYPALIDVSDVTKKFPVQSAIPSAKFADWLQDRWQSFNLIPTASAEDLDSLITGFFSNAAQDARNRWGAPLHEMWKGALVGAGAFTVKLIERGGGVSYIAEVATVSVITPFVGAVVIGVGVGLAADRVRNWVDTKQLDGTTSAGELYNSLVAGTRFSNEPAPEIPAQEAQQPALKNTPARTASPSNIQDLANLADMADMADKSDKQDFNFAIDLADKCTRRRDFACTNEQIAEASKLASGSSDRQLLATARQNMANEKMRIAEEARLRAEEERRLAEAKEQQRIAQAARQRQQEAEASESSGFQWGKALVMLGTGAVVGGRMSSEAQGKFIEGVLKDSMPGQDGVSNTNANANAYAAEQKARQNIADQQFRERQAQKMADEAANNERLMKAARESRLPNGGQQTSAQQKVNNVTLPTAQREAPISRTAENRAAAAQTSRSDESWHEEFTIVEFVSGKTSQYDEGNIPGDVIASKMNSSGNAQALWSTGTVTQYTGCGTCGVGSKITVVVKYFNGAGTLNNTDTHVYTRNK